MQRKSHVNYYPFSHGCGGADSGTRGGFALLRCHVPPPAFWQLMHASASQKPQIWNLGSLNLYLSSVCTMNPQIYIWWQFAHSLDARAELSCVARPGCVCGRTLSCCIVLSFSICSGSECREPAGSSPAIPYSDCRLFVDHQEKKKTLKRDKLLAD